MISNKRFFVTSQNNLKIYFEIMSDNLDDAYIIVVDEQGNERKQKFENSVFYKSGNHKFSMKCNDLYDLCNLLQRNKNNLSVEKILERADKFNKTIFFYYGKNEKLEQVWGTRCNLCGCEAKKFARFFNQCSGCNNLNKVTDNEIFKKTSSIKHNNRYLYSDDYVNTKTKVRILCKCGYIFYQKPSEHLRGKGCPKCKISSGELAVEKWLLENNEDFIWQHKFDDLKNINHLVLDFYCPSKNTIIEYDGEGHTELEFYVRRKIKNPEIALKNVQHNDNLKNEYAERNGIKMLRICYKDKKRINNILSQYFYGENYAK